VLARLRALVRGAHAAGDPRPRARIVWLVAEGAQRVVQENGVGLHKRPSLAHGAAAPSV
jgi:hypothetical protein